MLDRRDAVISEHRAVKPVELGLVQVGRDDAFLEVVEHETAGGRAEILELWSCVQICWLDSRPPAESCAESSAGSSRTGAASPAILMSRISGSGHRSRIRLTVSDLPSNSFP